ncbi:MULTISPECIES: histidine kinase [Brevibacterium]|uniref:Signal transduction histidine kinase subgroup 3 dimerisation and phosphoacceptor domain-containing protein n=1 Tax=Brevibacterium luteolum TaxID=199591 RepID=A0A2N6PFC9_9MICO|nr:MULTISPECIES: histidine kinase [Brevibacterium]PMB97378.1 hypothetical protein CJ198_11360 [Brevibacterium luteolum]
MADVRENLPLIRRLSSRTQLGQFGVPVLLALLLVGLGIMDATQVEAAEFPFIPLSLLGIGMLTIPFSPWIMVATVGFAGAYLIVTDTTFLGIASLLLPVVVAYFVARGLVKHAFALGIVFLVAVMAPGVRSYDASVFVSSLVFWTIILVLALGAGGFIRFLLRREEAAVEQNQKALDELSDQLSRDLHDSVGGVLTRVSLLAQQARASGGDKAAENLDLIVAETHAASSEVRLLLRRLRDVDDMIRGDGAAEPGSDVPRPAKKPSAAARASDPVIAHGPMTVRQLLRSYSDRLRVYGFAVESAVEPQASEALEQYVRLLGRLLDESILNTIKYASPDEPVHAVFTRSETHVKVVLSNTESPEGNPNPADSSGLGLANLARDIEAAGGILTTGRLTPPVVEGAEATDSQWQLCVELPAAPAGQPTPHTEVPSDNR